MPAISGLRWLIGINSLFVGFLLVLLVLGVGFTMSGWWHDSLVPSKSPDEPTIYSRPDFGILVMGKTELEVLEMLGKPERTSTDTDATYWHYRKRTRDPVTGEPDSDAQLVFRNGKVNALGF